MIAKLIRLAIVIHLLTLASVGAQGALTDEIKNLKAALSSELKKPEYHRSTINIIQPDDKVEKFHIQLIVDEALAKEQEQLLRALLEKHAPGILKKKGINEGIASPVKSYPFSTFLNELQDYANKEIVGGMNPILDLKLVPMSASGKQPAILLRREKSITSKQSIDAATKLQANAKWKAKLGDLEIRDGTLNADNKLTLMSNQMLVLSTAMDKQAATNPAWCRARADMGWRFPLDHKGAFPITLTLDESDAQAQEKTLREFITPGVDELMKRGIVSITKTTLPLSKFLNELQTKLNAEKKHGNSPVLEMRLLGAPMDKLPADVQQKAVLVRRETATNAVRDSAEALSQTPAWKATFGRFEILDGTPTRYPLSSTATKVLGVVQAVQTKAATDPAFARSWLRTEIQFPPTGANAFTLHLTLDEADVKRQAQVIQSDAIENNLKELIESKIVSVKTDPMKISAFLNELHRQLRETGNSGSSPVLNLAFLGTFHSEGQQRTKARLLLRNLSSEADVLAQAKELCQSKEWSSQFGGFVFEAAQGTIPPLSKTGNQVQVAVNKLRTSQSSKPDLYRSWAEMMIQFPPGGGGGFGVNLILDELDVERQESALRDLVKDQAGDLLKNKLLTVSTTKLPISLFLNELQKKLRPLFGGRRGVIIDAHFAIDAMSKKPLIVLLLNPTISKFDPTAIQKAAKDLAESTPRFRSLRRFEIEPRSLSGSTPKEKTSLSQISFQPRVVQPTLPVGEISKQALEVYQAVLDAMGTSTDYSRIWMDYETKFPLGSKGSHILHLFCDVDEKSEQAQRIRDLINKKSPMLLKNQAVKIELHFWEVSKFINAVNNRLASKYPQLGRSPILNGFYTRKPDDRFKLVLQMEPLSLAAKGKGITIADITNEATEMIPLFDFGDETFKIDVRTGADEASRALTPKAIEMRKLLREVRKRLYSDSRYQRIWVEMDRRLPLDSKASYTLSLSLDSDDTQKQTDAMKKLFEDLSPGLTKDPSVNIKTANLWPVSDLLKQAQEAIDLRLDLGGCLLSSGVFIENAGTNQIELVLVGRVTNEEQARAIEELTKNIRSGNPGLRRKLSQFDIVRAHVITTGEEVPSANLEKGDLLGLTLVDPSVRTAKAWFYKGYNHYGKCESEKAQEAFRLSVLEWPNNREYRFWRVVAYLQAKDEKRAADHLRILVRKWRQETSLYEEYSQWESFERLQGPIRRQLDKMALKLVSDLD